MNKTILIVDDDVHIGNMIEEVLSFEDYSVLRAYSGTEALLILNNRKPDLVLLDLMLPGLNGEEILSQIKDIPVIIVSAKSDISDKVSLLLGGAADYITKPFDTKELLARIAVALRTHTKNSSGVIINFDKITMNIDAHSITVNGSSVKLTKTEYAILKLLMQNPEQVITKSAILDNISEDTPDCMESSLKVHISNLRKKLRDASDKDYIEAVWGIGFKMRKQEQ